MALRIVVTAPYFGEAKFGGGELWCKEVALALQERGHEVRVVTTNLTRHRSAFEPKAPRRGQAWGLDVRRHRVSLLAGLALKPVGFFPLAPTLPLDKSFAWADVVLVSNIEDPTSALAVLGARLARKPVVVMANTHLELARRARIDRRVVLAAMEGTRASYFMLQTDAERPFWLGRVEDRRVLGAVGSGVHPLAAERDEPRAAARRALGLREDEGVVLFLGRLHWNKGVLRAVEAVHRLRRRGQDARLHLVGFAEDHPAKLRGRRVMLDEVLRSWPPETVNLVGPVDEAGKHRWLSACDALVLPSHNESFGIVFLEAWQHGKPVVGWRTGGMPFVVRDGEDGHVVGSVEELAERLGMLLSKQEHAAWLGEAGRRKVAQGHAWADVAARVEANLLLALERERARLGAEDTSEEIREVLG